MYEEGTYFENPNRHKEDSKYKVEAIKKILFNFVDNNEIEINSYADIGCGSGDIVKMLGAELKNKFSSLNTLKGYDISPHVKDLKDENVEFYCQDFAKSDDYIDLVSLNDVFEHISDPMMFLKQVGKRAKYIVMHIPLEDCLSVNLRNLQKNKIKNPGHLIYLNINSALNLITFSGLKILEYQYSIASVKAPSNRKSILQKIGFPFKRILIKINPYIYSRVFGISIVVIAKGLNE